MPPAKSSMPLLDKIMASTHIILSCKPLCKYMFTLSFTDVTIYRIGQIGAADSQLLIVTLNYHQTQINNADYLLVDTEASKTAYGTLALTAPSEKGLYEICALVVPDPTKPNDFLPLENAYRFTLNVI